MGKRPTPLDRLRELEEQADAAAALLNAAMARARRMGLEVTPKIEDGQVSVTVSRPHREEEK